jgi:hypothetical protein
MTESLVPPASSLAPLVEQPLGSYIRRKGRFGFASGQYLQRFFIGNAPSDQLAPDGRLPGMAAPTLDTQGEER